MAWLKVEQSIRDHRKVLALAGRLDIEPPHAIGHLLSLWLWAIDNAPDGDLSRVTSKVIAKTVARASQWSGDACDFMNALIEAGWLDSANDSIAIHDWSDYVGSLIECRDIKRLQARERQKRRREKLKDGDENSHAFVTRDSRTCNAPIEKSRVEYIESVADKPPRPRFTPPSADEVGEYCSEKGYGIDPQCFVDFYAAKGWMVGKNKMKDWKAAVRTWARRDKSQAASQSPPAPKASYTELDENGEEVVVFR